MCCRKEVVKISLPGAGGGFGLKLPRAKKGEERKRKDTEWRKMIPWEV
jgi:hypothetical protein